MVVAGCVRPLPGESSICPQNCHTFCTCFGDQREIAIFKGTMQSAETYSNVFPTLFASATGSGDATQIGRFAVRYKLEMNLLDLSVTETAYFVTPYGDSLQAKAVGQASGIFTLKRLFSLTRGVTASTFDGTILIP